MTREVLSTWTIYDHPRELPTRFVARRFEAGPDGEARPTHDVIVATTLEALRDYFFRHGLVCFTRAPQDEPQIVETWL